MEVQRDEPHTAIATEEDDDPLVLSSHTLEALKEFLNEQKQKQNPQFEDESSTNEVSLVKENWNLSQFWYDQNTAEIIAEEVQRLCIETSSSAVCIACPTLYAYLKKIDPNISIQLLEYDKRFEQYGSDFTFYDYNEPEDLPQELKHSYRVVVADPPYLSKECLEKVSKTMKFLLQPEDSYLLLLTGGVQKERAAELLGLHPCGFRPQHANKLGNEFLLYTNYDPVERLGGWEQNE